MKSYTLLSWQDMRGGYSLLHYVDDGRTLCGRGHVPAGRETRTDGVMCRLCAKMKRRRREWVREGEIVY